MPIEDWVAQNLAAMLLATPWREHHQRDCLRRFCPPDTVDAQAELLEDLTNTFSSVVPPSPKMLERFLGAHPVFHVATAYYLDEPEDLPFCLDPPLFAPCERFAGLQLPELTTLADVATWLGTTHGELDWFADTWRQHSATRIPDLLHYTYRTIPKRDGSSRLIEEPKPRLKTMQRKILRDILSKVPVHEAAHGFVTGRSCLTAARRHAGETIVIAVDLKDFFPATRLSRVHRLFRNLGYPHNVARCLTDLCCTATPLHVVKRLKHPHGTAWKGRKRFRTRHLPQGAPTSPALANLAAFTLDVRVAGLARRFDVAYTRYADDMAFSGDEVFAARRHRFLEVLQRIVSQTGYELHPEKTRVMPHNSSQRVTGIVVNEHLNIDRRTFDALKATLNNCARHGPHSQNREHHENFRAHLDGRVNWVENINPQRGEKLRRIFDEIAW